MNSPTRYSDVALLVKLTAVAVSRDFLDRIGFNEAIRKAIRLPTDPGLVELFQKLVPNYDWASAQATPGFYEAPRWLGYWSTPHMYWASDGVLKLAVPEPAAMAELFERVRIAHFAVRGSPPFVNARDGDPSHMLLHDSEHSQLFVTSFEQAEARLVKQLRPNF